MDILLLIIGFILIIIGIIGCILPVIPGTPIGYIGLLLLHFTSKVDLSNFTLILTAILVIIVTVLDYFMPVWSTKIAGGSKWGTRGSAIGLIVGLFSGLWGIFVFPFIGALMGEVLYQYYKADNNTSSEKLKKSLTAAFGSFIGIMLGIGLKLAVSCFIAFIFVKEVIIGYFS